MTLAAFALLAALAASDGAASSASPPPANTAAPKDAAPRNAAPPASKPVPSIRLDRAFTSTKWKRPTQILQRPDDNDQLYVLEQGGRIRVVRASMPQAPAALFMDIDDRVNFGSNEEGLLSVAFHPRFKENHEFFVYYSAEKPRRAILSRFKAIPAPKASAPGDAVAPASGGAKGATSGTEKGPSKDDGAKPGAAATDDAAAPATLDFVGDPGSEEILLAIDEPYWNHNGGTVLFGPDGMLYLSIGDGGAANDPHENGQNLGTLLAKIVRIDVDHRDGDKPYAVPRDNPFVGRADAPAGVRPEIWAYGLRNAWRMSFDRQTGALWAGDVGQNLWEEVDRIERGGNYGWNLREGRHAFRKEGESLGQMIDPVFEYGRKEGVSVTGGSVYRGTRFPELAGVYLFADYGYGTVWGARVDGVVEGRPAGAPSVVFKKGGVMISSFGETNDGELYVTAFEGSEQGPGAIYRVAARD
ncbi:MAG: PQQ-dependent sugar dehydrogenase [Phycisphaerales bacterium]